MRMGMMAIAAALLATSTFVQAKGFDAAAFVSTKMEIAAKTPMKSADWKKFDAAFAKRASSTSEDAFVGCMNRELKNTSASFSVKKK